MSVALTITGSDPYYKRVVSELSTDLDEVVPGDAFHALVYGEVEKARQLYYAAIRLENRASDKGYLRWGFVSTREYLYREAMTQFWKDKMDQAYIWYRHVCAKYKLRCIATTYYSKDSQEGHTVITNLWEEDDLVHT